MNQSFKGDILIVDDTPANLQVLGGMLKDAGYKVRPVPNGRIALRAVENQSPDLILLDINMPELDGYQTCERLKADPRFADIPVIFLSALTETEDKVKAFNAGGVDYVSKPFQFAEVQVRVETHLRIARLKAELEERYRELKQLEDMRDSLTHMIVHDLRSPLTGIVSSLQMLAMDAAALGPESEEDVARALRSATSLIQMINGLLDVNKMESGELTLKASQADLVPTVRAALESLSGLVRGRNVSVEAPDGAVLALHDSSLVERVVANLVSNALRFTPEKGSVAVHVRSGERARVEVRDTGPGIPEEYYDKIFEKFGQIDARAEKKKFSTGLGLTFCKLTVEAHGGEIGVESVLEEGSTFWFELPGAGQAGS